jgi:hypothetical protein
MLLDGAGVCGVVGLMDVRRIKKKDDGPGFACWFMNEHSLRRTGRGYDRIEMYGVATVGGTGTSF